MNGGSDTFIQRMTVLSPLMNTIGQCGFSVHKFEYSPDFDGWFCIHFRSKGRGTIDWYKIERVDGRDPFIVLLKRKVPPDTQEIGDYSSEDYSTIGGKEFDMQNSWEGA